MPESNGLDQCLNQFNVDSIHIQFRVRTRTRTTIYRTEIKGSNDLTYSYSGHRNLNLNFHFSSVGFLDNGESRVFKTHHVAASATFFGAKMWMPT